MATEIAIIGLGNMGGSLLKGLQASEACKDFELYGFDSHNERRERFGQHGRVKVVDSLLDLPLESGTIVLCIKPHDLPVLSGEIKEALGKEATIISILAGVTLATLSSSLDFKGSVVQAMPNIAATIGEAATAMCANEQCTGPKERCLRWYLRLSARPTGPKSL